MKRKQFIISLFISIFLLSSCEEISIRTVVNKDGSFTRTIMVTGDSNEVLKSELPYPVDETWERTFLKDTTDNNDYILVYSKSFKSSKLLNREINRDTSWRKNLKRQIEVEKKFGFFYSYLVYRETIKAANPFTKLDYKDYISKEDLLWLSGKKLALNSSDSAKIDDAEKRAETYLQKAFTEEIIAALKKGVEQFNNRAIRPELIDEYRDSIALKIQDWDFKSAMDFVDYLAEWTNDNSVYKLKKTIPALFENIDDDTKFIKDIFSMQAYKVYVEMPGIITETNSLSMNGGQAQWNVTASSILIEDYVMLVESRIVNYWMFILTGIVLISFIGLILWKSRK
ncbi:MAG: hypothetical protein GXO89_09125 [Chlorobi bacterium]|nr:hypothetical protein [Chlorobiota bacterium]